MQMEKDHPRALFLTIEKQANNSKSSCYCITAIFLPAPNQLGIRITPIPLSRNFAYHRFAGLDIATEGVLIGLLEFEPRLFLKRFRAAMQYNTEGAASFKIRDFLSRFELKFTLHTLLYEHL
jgi:hypothetical protein